MAIDFPNSPTLNQEFTSGGTTWIWDGTKWNIKSATNNLTTAPVGTMLDWPTSGSYPTAYLRADGSAVSRSTYNNLFALIGTAYGSGDGSTTFNLPNISAAGAGSPVKIIKGLSSGVVEPSTVAHATTHTQGGTDAISVTLNQIPSYQSYRNVIINGAMSVAQRSSSIPSITGGNYYTADRWATVLVTQGTWTQSVENDAPTGSGFRKSLKMLCTVADASPAANDIIILRQGIEAQNLQHFKKGTTSAESWALSFWVKANLTGTYVAYLNHDPATRTVSASYTINAVNTWEKKTIIFPADTSGVITNDNALGVWLNFALGAGSTFNPVGGTLNTVWNASNNATVMPGQVNLAGSVNNYWQVTGVQLEPVIVTPFEVEPFETTLRKCQRYYQGVTFISTAVSTGEMGGAQFRTPMRAAPSGSFTLYPSSDGLTGSANTVTRVGVGSVAVGTGTAVGFSSVGLLGIYCTGLSSGGVYSGHFAISAEL